MRRGWLEGTAAACLAASAMFSALAADAPVRTAGGAPGDTAQARVAEAALSHFRADLLEIVARGGWSSDKWGVLVVSLDRGDTLFALNENQPFVPASNLKLFTSAAALRGLGPDFRFGTYLLADGPIEDGKLEGDLVLYGTGDPSFSELFHRRPNAVWRAFADSLARLGVTEVTGRLVADASYFGRTGVSLGWQDSYSTDAYAALPGALAFNDNAVSLRILPGEAPGWRPRIDFFPGGGRGISVVNTARTVAGGRTRLAVRKMAYDGPIVVSGQINARSRDVWRQVAVSSPARYAGATLRDALESQGIRVLGGLEVVRRPEDSRLSGRAVHAPAFSGDRTRLLATHSSPPLIDILHVVNRRSNNLYAEQVLRTLGRVETGAATLEAGTRAALGQLEAIGVNLDGLLMRDGSGLSADNRAEPATIVSLLARMADTPDGAAFAGTLPEAGNARGLRRMARTAAEGRLRAKTGTIERVSALSGYVRAANGERLGFSIVANGVPSTWRAKRVEDALGARLARFERPRRAGLAVAASAPMLPPPTSATAGAGAPVGRAAPGGGEASYTIRRGDTLEAIARRHGVTVADLRRANPGVRDRRLMPGQVLTLP
ncbi:MAG: D-alanyl-D-alanine carboxypeptidase/D-alanyl-D-alanine-endopeptidase [Gemmatimonadota bacterium]